MDIEPGIYIQGKHAVRRVGERGSARWEYVEFSASGDRAFRASCSAVQLKKWGKQITEEEARQLIPNMDAQLANLQLHKGQQQVALASIAVQFAPDEELIAELLRRGYAVVDSPAADSTSEC